jgi:hypothetical protein
MLAKVGLVFRQWSQHMAMRAALGSVTLFSLIYVSSAGGHWM